MWPDNETERDFLNFTGVAGTVAEIIVQANGRPISIGVSGAWGMGKSSMLKLIRSSLQERNDEFVFVEFNAWLYQGYDDARAALLEVIATALAKEAAKRQTGLDKAQELLGRVNWLRAAKLTASSALALSLGVPPVGLIGEIYGFAGKIASGNGNHEGVTGAGDILQTVVDEGADLLRPRADRSPPKEIHAIRSCFEEALSKIGVKMVVLIDDLDRCLPPTTISTLEAIRLFLFIKGTAFVIAADDAMIKHSVRSHFNGVEDSLVDNYFDKLVQIPIRVPPLGTQEVRAYLMLLFIENSTLTESDKEDIRARVCKQLAQTWRGGRVDRAFIQTTHPNLPPELKSRFDTADRLAPLMTTSSQISGNPRLIKRFLNALSIRMAISNSHGVGVDEAVLAKMLLFERCAASAAFNALTKAVINDAEGKPRLLKQWEEHALLDEQLDLDHPWDDPFIREWLTVPPRISDLDLRGVLYVSREHAPLITVEDRLSSEGAELLGAVLEHPDMAAALDERLRGLPKTELTIIMDRLLDRARQIQEWGTPPILDGCLAVAKADPSQGTRVAVFLAERPAAQIRPSIVPKVGDQPWASEVLRSWQKVNVASTVKAAISQELSRIGNV